MAVHDSRAVMDPPQSTARPKPSFLTIPPEIREQIYEFILHPDANRWCLDNEYASYDFAPALVLFRLNRQIYIESRKIFFRLNTFVRIESPWPEAQEHVAIEGHVPILMTKDKAAKFENWTLAVSIDAPQYEMLRLDAQHFVILVQDLEKFTQMWFYSDLSHPGLNASLSLGLKLQDPLAPSYEEKRIPKALQKRLILPFGSVKDLRHTVVTGDPKPYPSIEAELRKTQAEPYKSAERCLEDASRLKAEGNSALQAGDYRRALALYTEAWRAMHVLIRGRQRHIHADPFFGRDLTEAPYAGKNGQQERLLLRVQLVANTCLAYLKLEDWEECRFWGMRSINMLRGAMGADEMHGDLTPENEAVTGFPAADQMGKIYYRTAVAAKELGDKAEARQLLKVAVIYLPHDRSVRKEQAAVALRI